MKVIAVILAGGKGTRMGTNISKQFISVKDKPILCHTLESFLRCEMIDEVVLVVGKDEMEYCKNEILDKYQLCVSKLVYGGKERQDSVSNALKEIDKNSIVLIHDAARPLVTNKIIEDGILFAKQYGAAAPGVTPKDTIKIKDSNNFSIQTPNRDDLVAIQTPQCFKYDIIASCHSEISEKNIKVTDDTMAVEMFGHKVFIYEGDYCNIKITTKEDLIFAERLL